MQYDELVTTQANVDITVELYEAALQDSRSDFFKTFITPLLNNHDPKTIMLFWIYFSSQGIGMTRPVEDWIIRAGNQCKTLGFSELGIQLCKHAVHEAGHEEMMIADTKTLAQEWNQRYTPILNADDLLNQKYNPSVLAYQKLHEDCIHSNHPYAQIAIEYEIENLSVMCGTPILQHTLTVLGDDFKDCLTFVDDHIKIDASHTEFNRRVLSKFLKNHPETLDTLLTIGKKALSVYGSFLGQCYASALESVKAHS